MKMWEYRALTYNGGVYCIECLPVDPDMEEPDHTGTAPGPVFADQEWDYYPTCAVCGTTHDYVGLTEEVMSERYAVMCLPPGANDDTPHLMYIDRSYVSVDEAIDAADGWAWVQHEAGGNGRFVVKQESDGRVVYSVEIGG